MQETQSFLEMEHWMQQALLQELRCFLGNGFSARKEIDQDCSFHLGVLTHLAAFNATWVGWYFLGNILREGIIL